MEHIGEMCYIIWGVGGRDKDVVLAWSFLLTFTCSLVSLTDSQPCGVINDWREFSVPKDKTCRADPPPVVYLHVLHAIEIQLPQRFNGVSMSGQGAFC